MDTTHDDVATFLAAMWGNGPHALCWQTPGMRFAHVFVDKPEAILTDLDNLQTADVWIGAHPLKDKPASGRGGASDVAEVAALAADLDWADPTRKTDDELPSEAEVRRRLTALGPEIQPSIIVNSGHGLQPWWPLGFPVSPAVGEELIGRLNASLAKVGLVNGRSDLASILRLPGTRNLKGDPRDVHFEHIDGDYRFLLEYLRKRMPEILAVGRIGAGGTRHQRGSVTDAQQELHDYVVEHHGGHGTYVAADGSMHLTRPGKDAKAGTSASIITGEQGHALLTVFTSNWADLGPVPPEPYRTWRLRGDELVRAHLDPLDGLTMHATSPHVEVATEPEVVAPVQAIPLITFESIPNPFVLPALTWHAIALLARPTHGEIAGAEKSLKSYTALALMVGLASGLPVFGRFDVPERQRVVALVGEGGRGPWLRRLHAVCAAYGIEPGEITEWLRFSTQTASVTSVRFIEGLRQELETFGPSLVLLDPWYAYASGQADSSQMTEVGASLEMYGAVCRDHGATGMVNHHFNRKSESPGLRQITGAGHAEWVDSWLLLKHRQPAQPGEGLYRLRLDVGSRQWGGERYDLDYRIDPLTQDVAWSIGVAGEDHDEGEVDPLRAIKLEILRKGRRTDKPMHREGWVTRIKHRRADVLVAFDELVEEGRIVAVSEMTSGSHKVPTFEVNDEMED